MEQLIEKYEYLVKANIRKYLPSKMYDEDYHQIGLIGLWEALKRYKNLPTAKFETYASCIIRNKLIDEVRKESSQRQRLNNTSNTASLEQSLSKDLNDVHLKDVIEDKSNGKVIDLKGWADSLNKDECKIIRLKSLGYTNQEASSIMHISRYEIDKRLKNAKEKWENNVL